MEVKNYSETPRDKDGWVNAHLFKPKLFDLVHLAFEDSKSLTGWWNGTEWCCRRNKDDKPVVRWKKTSHHNG